MAASGTFTFSEADGYAGGFGDARIQLTITGAGDFEARLTWLKLKHLEVRRCSESLPRIAYISLPAERVFLSFSVGRTSIVSDGSTLRIGDMILHGRGGSTYQRSDGACRWGLISLSAEEFASCGKALTGHVMAPPSANRILRPARAQMSRFKRLFAQACRLAEAEPSLVQRPEVARAMEQELLHAVINCLVADEADDNSKTRHHHAVVMARFEERLRKGVDRKLNVPVLCAQIGVPERSLRMCCAKFLGVSPARYLLLRRLNKAHSALRRADPSIATVAEVARNHQFLELGRFAVMYRTTFGESPSVTLQRHPLP